MLRVTLSEASNEDVMVRWATLNSQSPDRARGGQGYAYDYWHARGEIVIRCGETSGTGAVWLNQDSRDEPVGEVSAHVYDPLPTVPGSGLLDGCHVMGVALVASHHVCDALAVGHHFTAYLEELPVSPLEAFGKLVELSDLGAPQQCSHTDQNYRVDPERNRRFHTGTIHRCRYRTISLILF